MVSYYVLTFFYSYLGHWYYYYYLGHRISIESWKRGCKGIGIDIHVKSNLLFMFVDCFILLETFIDQVKK